MIVLVLLVGILQGCQSSPNTLTPTTSSMQEFNDSTATHVVSLNWTYELNGTKCPIIYDSQESSRRIFVIPIYGSQNFTVKLVCSNSDYPKSVSNSTHCLNSTLDANVIASLFSLCPKESPSREPTTSSTYRTHWSTSTTLSPCRITTHRHHRVYWPAHHRRFRRLGCFGKRICR